MQEMLLNEMKRKMHVKTIWLFTVWILVVFSRCFSETTIQTQGIPINGEFIGVTFDPYFRLAGFTRRQANSGYPSTSCLKDDMEAMLKVISTRFSHVYITESVKALKEETDIMTCGYLIPEISANLNKNENFSRLKLTLSTEFEFDENDAIKNIDSAWKLASSANKIYPKTVSSITIKLPHLTIPKLQISEEEYMSRIHRVLKHTKSLSKSSQLTNDSSIKIGINLEMWSCKEHHGNLPHIVLKYLRHVDEIHVYESPSKVQYHLGPYITFTEMSKSIVRCNVNIKRSSNNTISVIFHLNWSKFEDSDELLLTNFATFWRLFSHLAVQEGLLIMVSNAFDKSMSHNGVARKYYIDAWWGINSNDINNITSSAFYENVEELSNFDEKFKYMNTSHSRASNTSWQLSGVVFDPFILADQLPNAQCTSRQEIHIKVMLELISSRYTYVTNYWPVTAPVEDMLRCSDFISSVAAKINREHNTIKLNVILTTEVSRLTQYSADIERTLDDMKFAWNLATSANQLFNGTVSALILENHSVEWKFFNPNIFKTLKNRLNSHLNISIRQPIKFRINFPFWENDGEQNLKRRLKYMDVDIIQYSAQITSDLNLSVSEMAFNIIAEAARRKKEIEAECQNFVTVILKLAWIQDEDILTFTMNTFNRIKIFQYVRELALKEEIVVLFYTAFDSPHSLNPGVRRTGWWKLVNKTISRTAFVERALEMIETANQSNMTEKFMGNMTIIGKSFDEKYSSDSLILTFSLVVSGLLLLVAGVAIVFLYRYKKQLRGQNISDKDIEEFMNGTNFVTRRKEVGLELDMVNVPYNKKFELPKDSFTINDRDILGAGAFGCVLKGSIYGIEKQVAFKISSAASSVISLKSLLSEIKVMSYLGSNEYIVNLLGAYTAELKSGIVYVITELCDNGSLEKYLRLQQNNKNFVNVCKSNEADRIFQGQADMLRWSYQIASGMEYIASKHVVHADLATRNILLTSSFTAKISDFGLSRRLYNYTNYVKHQQEPFPWRWMAIESLKNLEFTEKSDVWAFGCTMWEIYSLGAVPYPGMSWSLNFMDELVNGFRLSCPVDASQEIFDLMSKCWLQLPSARPSFENIRAALMSILSEYIKQTSYVILQ